MDTLLPIFFTGKYFLNQLENPFNQRYSQINAFLLISEKYRILLILIAMVFLQKLSIACLLVVLVLHVGWISMLVISMFKTLKQKAKFFHSVIDAITTVVTELCHCGVIIISQFSKKFTTTTISEAIEEGGILETIGAILIGLVITAQLVRAVWKTVVFSRKPGT